MMPDYTQQLERLIAALAHKDTVPAWVVSIVSAVVGSVVTIFLGLWKERHDANGRRKRIERAIYGEILLNYSSLLGTLTTDLEFDRIAAHQQPFEGMFTFDALENAKARGDVLYDVPNFAVMRTLYKMFENISPVSGGGQHVKALAVEGVKTFESLLAAGKVNGSLIVEMSETCAPNLTSRLKALAEKKLNPGEQE